MKVERRTSKKPLPPRHFDPWKDAPSSARKVAYAPVEKPRRTPVEQNVKRSITMTPAQVHNLAQQGVLVPEMVRGMQQVGIIGRRKYPLRLGNAIAELAKWLRIPMCDGCSKRRLTLNRIVIWGWWRT